MGRMVIDQRIAERMPEIAAEIARPLGAIDRMVVLDGPDGLTKSLVGAVAQAGDALSELRGLAADNRDEGPSGGGGDDGPGPGDPGTPSPRGGDGEAAPPLEDLMPDPDAEPPEVPAEAEDEAGEPEAAEAEEAAAPDAVSGAVDVLRARLEQLEAGEGRGITEVLTESEADERLAQALGEVARDPEAVDRVLAGSRLSESSRQVARSLIGNFAGTRG